MRKKFPIEKSFGDHMYSIVNRNVITVYNIDTGEVKSYDISVSSKRARLFGKDNMLRDWIENALA